MSRFEKAFVGLASELRKAAWVAATFCAGLGYFQAHAVLGAAVAVGVWCVIEGAAFFVTVLAEKLHQE